MTVETHPGEPDIARRAPAFRPDIEGLRAIAILLVVAHHIDLPGFAGGYVGVDVFFVLSGYLITGLLLHEARATGTLGLAAFYARRARRLLPALSLMLLVTMAAGFVIFSPLEQPAAAGAALATAAYASNIVFAVQSTDYFAASVQSNPFLHGWSLAVEEQFYLAWPLIAGLALGVFRRGAGAAGGGLRLRRLRLTLGALAAASFALAVWLTATRQPWAFFSSPTRAWEFAIGGLAASLPLPAALPGRLAAQVPRAGWLGLLGLAVATTLFDDTTSFPGFAALLPALATAIVLLAGQAAPRSRLSRLLGLGPLQAIGRLSYSWYLWHWPVLVLALTFDSAPSLAVRIGLVVAALGVAWLSYRFVENPIRHHPRLVRRSGFSLAAAALLTVFCLAAGYGWTAIARRIHAAPAYARLARATLDRSILYQKGCIGNIFIVKANPCAFGPETAPTTIVLFGDSHAAQWFPTLQIVAEERGWRLLTLIKASCPSAAIENYFYTSIRRVYSECDQWRAAAFKAIAAERPQIVVLTNYASYPVEPAAWGLAMERTFAALGDAQIIQIRDTPAAGANVPICLAREAWRGWWAPSNAGCAFDLALGSRGEIFAAQLQAAAGARRVASLDLTAAICATAICPVERDGMILFTDSHHLTASFAATLAPALGREIDAALAQTGAAPR